MSYATDTGVITFTELDGGTDTIDIGVGTADSPSFTGLTISGLTNSKLLGVNGSGVVGEKNLNDFVGGTANRISVADDGDGTITLSTPQDIHTSATPTFASLTTTAHVTASGNISSSYTSTGSFGRVQASVIGGNSPVRIEADNINIDETGNITPKVGANISGSATSTGSFGTVMSAGDIVLPNQRFLRFGSHNGAARIYGDDGNDLMTFVTNAVERLRLGNTEAVFNEGGADYDFRIEGDTNSNLFTVDAGNERVGIGVSPANTLHVHKGTAGSVTGNQATTPLVVENDNHNFIQFLAPTNKSSGLYFGSPTGNLYRGELGYDNTNDIFKFYAGENKMLELAANKISGSAVSTGSFGRLISVGNSTVNGNLEVQGSLTAKELIVSSSVTNMVIAEKSGSTVFGDDVADTHQFTGSLNVTGSLHVRTDASGVGTTDRTHPVSYTHLTLPTICSV